MYALSNNKFLNDFIQRQATIIELPKTRTKKPVKGHAGGDGDFDNESEFAILIKEKPSKKAVLEYFRKRIEKLVSDDVM